MKEFSIARAKTDDIPDLKSIETECRLSPWSIEAYESQFRRPDSVILAARNPDGRVIGFLVGRVPLSDLSEEAEIHNIGALPQFQHQGVGSMLLDEFKVTCSQRRVSIIWLEVRVSNHIAISFYRSQGFIKRGVRPGFYTNPAEDAELMSLSLT